MKINQVEIGTIIILDGNYFEVGKITHTHLGRGKATIELIVKNLTTGQTLTRNFKSDEEVKAVDSEEKDVEYLYQDKANVYLADSDNRRYCLAKKNLANQIDFLKTDLTIRAIFIDDRLIRLKLPIKAKYLVVEAPPGLKGDTVQAGSKVVLLETGAEIKAPLFIKAGDLILVNIDKKEYLERVKND